jgi:predicted nucleic acid-binding protein
VGDGLAAADLTIGSPGFADIIIAATARHHGLTILSRNPRHFESLGVDVIDPFTRLPP